MTALLLDLALGGYHSNSPEEANKRQKPWYAELVRIQPFSPTSRKVDTRLRSDALAHLREKVDYLEEIQRRFSRSVPVCDVVDDALPCRGLPLGCVHEVKGASLASAIAFASLLAARISPKGAIVYIAQDRSFHALGLLPYGVRLEQCIHVSVRRSEDLAWTVLEALRCPQVSAVLAVMKTTDLTFCRRLQLATENSGATCFLLGEINSASMASVITRWRVSSINAPPGRGFDEVFWALELLYCRGAQPGKWIAAWRNGRLDILSSFSGAAKQDNPGAMLLSENTAAG